MSKPQLNRRYFLLGTGSAIASTLIASCSRQNLSSNTAVASGQISTVKVGISSIVPEDILKFIDKELAPGHNLKIQLVKFNDSVQINNALKSGEIDANLGQHQAFMENIAKRLNLDLVMLTRIYSYVFGLYSKRLKIQSVEQVSSGAIVGISNDPINRDRGLRLLRSLGWIKLKEKTGDLYTLLDVVDNPKQLQIKEVDSPALVRSLDDVDLAVLYATALAHARIKLEPIVNDPTNKEPIYRAGLTTLRSKANDSNLQKLNQLVVHPQVRDFITNTYKGTITPVF